MIYEGIARANSNKVLCTFDEPWANATDLAFSLIQDGYSIQVDEYGLEAPRGAYILAAYSNAKGTVAAIIAKYDK